MEQYSKRMAMGGRSKPDGTDGRLKFLPSQQSDLHSLLFHGHDGFEHEIWLYFSGDIRDRIGAFGTT